MDFDLFSEEPFLPDIGEQQAPLKDEEQDQAPQDEAPSTSGRPSSRGGRKTTKKETRPRGRPRLHTRDVTATERRRTQIRLAQRAYRQRKETTITALKQKVGVLERTLQGVNQSVLSFNERALASSFQEWDPDLSTRLQTMVEEVGEMVNEAMRASEGESEEEDPLESPSLESERPESQAELGLGVVAPSDLTLENPFVGSSFPTAPWDSRQAQQYPVPQPRSRDSLAEEELESAPSEQVYRPFQFCAFFPPQTIPLECRQRIEHAMSPSLNLPPPPMHVTTETSFTRRLIRQATEIGLQYIFNADVPPDRIAEHFQLNFACESRDTITDILRQLTSRSITESLELEPPFTNHIGGAGLHFPRKDVDTGILSTAWVSTLGCFGPFSNAEAEKADYVGWKFQDILSDLQMGGEWFDANDVEGFLRGLGVQLEASTSVVELPFEDKAKEAQSPPTVSGEILQQSPLERFMQTVETEDEECATFEPDNEFTTTIGVTPDDCSSLSSPTATRTTSRQMTTSTNATSATLFDPPVLHQAEPFSIPATFRRFLDVNHFVSLLLRHCVSLGRTAGFRRSSVTQALEAATYLQTVFAGTALI